MPSPAKVIHYTAQKSDVFVGWLVFGTIVVGIIVTVCVGGVACVVGILVVVVAAFTFLLKLVKYPRRELAWL